jgi:RNA polymerase sigma-70 factor (ECF subfamily)
MIPDFAATLRAAQAGDEHAVATLWEALNHRLVRFLYARNRDAAEDVAADTWLTVAEKLHQFDGEEIEFRAWLFSIARSRLVDWQRRARSRPQAPVDPATLLEWAASDDPADDAVTSVGTEASLALIAQLPEEQATVILLRVLAGLETEHVARIMGKQPGAVRMLQLRGLRRLEQILAADRHDERVTR